MDGDTWSSKEKILTINKALGGREGIEYKLKNSKYEVLQAIIPFFLTSIFLYIQCKKEDGWCYGSLYNLEMIDFIVMVYWFFYLVQMPLNIEIRETSDVGKPIVVSCPESEAASIYEQMAHRIQTKLQGQRSGTNYPIIK